MKYCVHCGKELMDESVYCPVCGNECDNPKGIRKEETKRRDSQGTYNEQIKEEVKSTEKKKENTMRVLAKVFLVIGTISTGLSFYFVSLIWCIPMTVYYFSKTKKGEDVGTGFKVCTIIFVSLLAGIFMFLDKDE